jgi:uncharacterized protein YndB with AHSA1/START domain
MIPASREKVFAAWTDPESMRTWMCPGDIQTADVTMDLRVGGALRIVMRSATQTFEHWGEFTVIEPPSRLAFTWIAAATDKAHTLVTVELREMGPEATELLLTHERFPRPEVREQYRGGWAAIVSLLERHIAHS